MIVGFTTGRSGSVSLAEWLNTWHEFKMAGKYFFSELSNDEKKAWHQEMTEDAERYGKTTGDISLDHINNLDYWLNTNHTLIYLVRDKDKTCQSILAHPRVHIWKRLFPQFNFDTIEGVEKYWDWYTDTILKHEDRFIIISPEQINIRRNQSENTTNGEQGSNREEKS